jgi:hypothetical protein
LLFSCGNPGNTNRTISEQSVDKPAQLTKAFQTEENFDLLTMQELRLLRSSVYADHGAFFDESDLRKYWRENTTWYDTLSRSRYAKLTDNEFIISLTTDDQELINRIDYRMAQLQQENYICTDDDTTANILNIVNMFQFGEITQQEIMDDLAVNNYALLPDSLPQLFQVYQRNDSLHIPNFVTVDLLAQLSHVFEDYLLRTVEEEYFAPMLADLCLSLHTASADQISKTTNAAIKDMAAYNAAFFAIPYNLLTGKSLKVSDDYKALVEEELANIARQESHRPVLLDIKTDFDYSAFKPYGHYTRTAELRRYFRAWKWLQLAPYRSDNRTQLQQTVLLALALQTAKTQSGVSAMDMYARLYGAMEWFTGLPAYSSTLDVALLLKKERITTIAAALDAKLLTKASAMITEAAKGKIPAVKYPAAFRNGIYFLPQPAYFDDELLQATLRANDTVWLAYPNQMAKMTEQIQRFKDWDASSYNKRLECMLAVQQNHRNSPVFAQKQAWNRKKLETSASLWTKMKHDVLLYGVIPDYPEPLPILTPPDTLMPEPLTMGYVEPALSYWTKMREWIELTDKTLTNYQLATDTLTAFSERLHRYITMMEDAAYRELNNERLPDETYRFMAHIGDSIQQFTLAMIEPEIDRWDWTTGTDRSVAVLKKVYQRNMTTDELYTATGNINNIYVIVEIDGYLYLTKGATFNYHEFHMPKEKVLKDEDWQEMREKLLSRQQHIMLKEP